MAHKKDPRRAADARRNALFVLPMAVFAVLLVALPIRYWFLKYLYMVVGSRKRT